MSRRLWLVAALGFGVLCMTPRLKAGDLRIPLPKRSLVTPVQRLNRDGVEAIRKHRYQKAKELFYRAYLYDPDDPFTLNNLGYIAELEGQVERAQRFYALAAQQASEAQVDVASLKRAEGRPVRAVVGNVGDLAMKVNRDNIEAMRLLSQGRIPEADMLLQRTLQQQPGNPFTLNNLGVTKEIEGDVESGLKYYTTAANARSGRPVVVTKDRFWRGKTISEMAAENARRLSDIMHSPESSSVKASRLNLAGVSALNRNDAAEARRNFRRAYAFDPSSAFSLNNVGYLAEMDGDWETAQSFYEQAQKAYRSDVRVGLATRHAAEGLRLSEVAADNGQGAESKMVAAQRIRQREQGPIELKRRDGRPVEDRPAAPPNTPPPVPQE